VTGDVSSLFRLLAARRAQPMAPGKAIESALWSAVGAGCVIDTSGNAEVGLGPLTLVAPVPPTKLTPPAPPAVAMLCTSDYL
jgi:hypothetical protein